MPQLYESLEFLCVRILVAGFLDVKFFVTAILMQKETGGNLAEILTNLAHLIRERFKIMGEVRTFSAQGRLTGYILTAVPVAMVSLAVWPGSRK